VTTPVHSISVAPAPRGVALGVGLVAFATLLYEVLLTRIFSVTLWYHFGFLAISLALLGTAAAAVLCFLFPERLVQGSHARTLALPAAVFAIVAPAAVAFHVAWKLPGFEHPGSFYPVFGGQLLLLFLAFFASGLCIAVALFRWSAQIGTVYFFDLLGAALGSLIGVPLMFVASPLALVFVASAAAFGAAACFASDGAHGRPRRAAALLAALAALGLAGWNDHADLLRIRAIKDFSPGRLQRDAERVLLELWSPVSRVAVVAPEVGSPSDVGGYWVSNDGAARMALRRFDGDTSALADMLEDPIQIAHHLKPGAQVLVVGAGGGADVLAALAFGQPSITAVEINPAIGEIVTEHFADFIGRIFEDPRVSLHIQEGRSFVAGSPDRYDVIQFTMIDSWGGAAAAGAYVFSENSLYTREALDDYLDHLAPGGILSITRYYEWGEGLRLTNLFADALERRGVLDVPQRMMVLKKVQGTSRHTVTVLLKNGTFTPEESRTALAVARRTGAQLLHVPHLGPDQIRTSRADAAFRAVIAPAAFGSSRAELLERTTRDITAPTDDRPFFFFTSRLSDLLSPDPREHAARRLAMPLLYAMNLTFAAIGLITIVLPLYVRAREDIRNAACRRRSLVYFALLGTGFMLIEISLIQRLTVFLGHPTWSFVVVLATLLLSTGLGSLFSARWSEPRPDVLAATLSGIVALVGSYGAILYDRFADLMWLGGAERVLVAAIVMAPAGFLMGTCFPLGVQIVRRFHPTLVPWGWGVNGAFSVFASVLSIAIAIQFGFKTALFCGVAAYALAIPLVLSFRGAAAGRQSSKGSEVGPAGACSSNSITLPNGSRP
jgi:spermidine synthase